MKIARLSFLRLGYAGSIVLIVVSTVGAHAQTTSAPIKQGLWQTQMTMSMQVTLPPDVEAKIAAMPAAQQAQMRSMMGGAAAKPTSSTVKSCVAKTMTPNDLLNEANEAQQKAGMKCTFTNQQVTAGAMSFDMSCTLTQGAASSHPQITTASGHAQFTMADSEHGTVTTHMTSTTSANGKTMSTTMDETAIYTYLGADCGDVKPDSPVAVTGQ